MREGFAERLHIAGNAFELLDGVLRGMGAPTCSFRSAARPSQN